MIPVRILRQAGITDTQIVDVLEREQAERREQLRINARNYRKRKSSMKTTIASSASYDGNDALARAPAYKESSSLSFLSSSKAERKKEAYQERKEDKEVPGVHYLPPPVDRKGKPYAFEAGTIRLNSRDFAIWTEAYPHLSLKAELLRLSKWADELGRERWFHAVKAQLANREAEAILAIEKIKAEAGRPHSVRHTKDDPYEGIV